MDSVLDALARHVRSPPSQAPGLAHSHPHKYVCTHGARDYRCGDTGGALVRALREELAVRRNVDVERWGKVTVGEVAYVGGHKYAANVLIYPHGDRIGYVSPEHAPQILDAVVAPQDPTFSLVPKGAQWRGRTGLGKEVRLTLWDAYLGARSP